eukprot:4687108-Lingulodinium_polyedra.AAC.1
MASMPVTAHDPDVSGRAPRVLPGSCARAIQSQRVHVLKKCERLRVLELAFDCLRSAAGTGKQLAVA